MSDPKSLNRIDRARHDQVMWSRVCPGCGDHVIVTVHRRSKQDAMSRDVKYGGTFYECGGDDGHLCWHMSSVSGDKPLYETFGPKATRSCPVNLVPNVG